MRGQTLGYTIIEVMLFLAISGALLSIAFAGFSGRQQAVEFSQGMTEIRDRIQSTFNESLNGTLSDAQGSCSVSSGRPVYLRDASTLGQGNALGSVNPCLFLGKVIAFGDAGNASAFNTYTVAGSRLSSSGQDQSSFNTATVNPTILDDLGANSLTVSGSLPWGIRIRQNLTATAVGKHYTNMVGSINGMKDSLAAPVVFAAPQSKQYYTHAEQVNKFNNPPPLIRWDTDTDYFAIGNNFQPAIMCFERSDGGQRAQIEVGAGASQSLKVKLTFDQCEAS